MSGELIEILQHILLQGLIYSLVVMGMYLSSRVIKFDDLTTEGSFGLGSVTATVAITLGLSPWLTLPLAMFSGAIAGAMTGILHTRFNINPLICGLIVTTALFSVCLKAAGANQSLYGYSTLFLPDASPLWILGVLLTLVTLLFWGLKWLLNSEVGLLLKALGTNPHMLTRLGKDIGSYKIFTLMISNSLIALSGSLLIQWNGFFSITGNIGTLIIGLIGLILSELIQRSFGIGLILGAIAYQALFSITIALQLDPVWNNLIKALLIVALIQLKPKKMIQESAIQRT